jgi:cbb3-type cytochrome oxidase maturation protein
LDALYLLIPISIFLLVVAIAIFFWAVNSDQYSDLDKEAHRILFDSESSKEPTSKEPSNEEKNGDDKSSEEAASDGENIATKKKGAQDD